LEGKRSADLYVPLRERSQDKNNLRTASVNVMK